MYVEDMNLHIGEFTEITWGPRRGRLGAWQHEAAARLGVLGGDGGGDGGAPHGLLPHHVAVLYNVNKENCFLVSNFFQT